MQVVRFTYDSTEVEISAFLLLFFRLSGIYISERYINLESDVCGKMLDALPDGERDAVSGGYDQYDMELYMIRSEEEYKTFRGYGDTDKTILLVPGSKWVELIDREFDRSRIVKCTFECSIELLEGLLFCMHKNCLISHKTYKALRVVADIFCRDHVMELLFCSKYIRTAENDEQYDKLLSRYIKVTDDLFSALGKMSSEWGNVSYIHLEYAALYAAYEGDLYCTRHNQPLLYTADSIAGVCGTLLSKKEVLLMLGDSIHLLAAQVYSDLLKNMGNAQTHYMAACKEYNAYTYSKIALSLINAQDYQMAVKYLSKGLKIHPVYCRAWYMLGICYIYLKQWQKAVSAFDNLEVILLPRMRLHLLRPMEIEYLFWASILAGDIVLQKMQQVTPAAERYSFAEKVWRSIDEIQFSQCIYGNDLAVESIRNKIKNELDINKLNSSLAEIYRINHLKEKETHAYEIDYTGRN